MLLKVVGQDGVVRQPFNWLAADALPLDDPEQIARLVTQLPNNGLRGYAGGLPHGHYLHKGRSRYEAGERLNLALTPELNGLRANDFVYVVYEPDEENRGRGGGGGGGGRASGSGDVSDDVNPNAFAAAQTAAERRRARAADGVVHGQADALRRNLTASDHQIADLRRQVLQLSDELRARPPHQSVTSALRSRSPPSPEAVAPLASHAGSPSVLVHETPPHPGDPGENARLRGLLAACQAELREKTARLETLEAWKAQHDCNASSKKASDLRTDIRDMRDTLRGVASERENVKRDLEARRRHLDDRYSHQVTHVGQSMIDEAQAKGGTHVMPMPYYMDPYKAPASAYNTATPEGCVCKLRVQTLNGDGNVVRRMYSSVTRDNQHAIILASLEGIVTDEIASADLIKAGVGYNRPNLLLLATEKHRWVLELEPADRTRWLDFLVTTNPGLAPQAAPGPNTPLLSQPRVGSSSIL